METYPARSAHQRESMRLWPVAVLVVTFMVALTAPCRAARVKDITTVEGIRSNQLYGFGLVAGLAGTGSGEDFSSRLTANLLNRLQMGRGLPELDSGNVSAVLVTADLPPFARKGTRIDVTVSALDESTSLRGGTLLFTPLQGADGRVYAVAQGSIAVGGFSFSGEAASIQQGHSTVGRIPEGATVEEEVPMRFVKEEEINLCLSNPDFTTASRIATAVNDKTPAEATVLDPGNVKVSLVDTHRRDDVMRQITAIQTLNVRPDSRAVVIINQRSGTVVAGQDVTISPVAVSHGNLTVVTSEQPVVSQPPPFSPGGETETVPRTEMGIIESPLKEGGLTVLDRSTTVNDVARALNLLGAGPREMISIFQAMKKAGALHADLRIM